MRLITLLLCLSVFTAPALAAGPVVYGAAIDPAGAATPLGAATADIEAHAGVRRKFSGRITDVCQKKGCWVMLEDRGEVARVMLGDHDFAIPAQVRGRAVVQGVLSRHELDEHAATHLAEDAGSDTPVDRFEYRIVASGVEVSG